MPKKIKIFGERNTATNALTQIIETNSNTFLHPSVVSGLDNQIVPLIRKARKQGKSATVIEQMIDEVFFGRPVEQQWKHCATNFEGAQIDPDTHFILLVRHPLSWVNALHQNPYHKLIDEPLKLQDFLNCQWKTVRRDNLEKEFYKPVELYEEKIRSYRDFIGILEAEQISYSVLKFEDVVMDQKGCFEKISDHLDEPKIKFAEVTKSTKKDEDKDLAFYRNRYENELWKDEIEPSVLTSFRFDDSLLKWMDYTL